MKGTVRVGSHIARVACKCSRSMPTKQTLKIKTSVWSSQKEEVGLTKRSWREQGGDATWKSREAPMREGESDLNL